jgi:hypothetical protein
MSYELSKGGNDVEAAYLPRGVGCLIVIDSLNRLVIVSWIEFWSSAISEVTSFPSCSREPSSDTDDNPSLSLPEDPQQSTSVVLTRFGDAPEAMEIAA